MPKQPIDRQDRKAASVVVAAAIVLSACGSSATSIKVASTAAPAAAKPLFPVALAPFPSLKYVAPSGGSTYSAVLGPQTCAGPHNALHVEKNVLSYGDDFTACLDLETGALTASAKSTLLPNRGTPLRPDFNETIAMPLASEHYFPYLSRLEEITLSLSVLGQVAADDALTAIAAQLKADPKIDALALNTAAVSQDRNSISLNFNVKTSVDRTLLVRFGDAQQVYVLQAIPVKTTDSRIDVTLTKPVNFDYRDSTSVQAYLVPNGSGANDALVQASQLFPYLTTETVEVWPLNSAVTLYAGQANPLVVNWATIKDRTVIVRLLNEAGQLVSEQRVDVGAAPAGGDQPPEAARTEVSLDLAAALPTGEHYTLVAHLVPRGGQWDDEIAKFAKSNIIHVKN